LDAETHTHTQYVKVPDKKLGTDSLSTQDEFSLNLLPPPPLDLPGDLGKCLGEFSDASFHGNQKLPVYHDVGELNPNPSPIHMSGVNPLSTFRGT
jgi:hypothetical protein